MVDVSKAKSELSPCIKFVIRWFDENGFDAKLITYNTSKTVFEVSKNGIDDKLEVSANRENVDTISSYMAFFAQSFDRKCENEKLKQELKKKGIM